jgi:stage II sporulation protein M
MLTEYYKRSWKIIKQNKKVIFALTAVYILFLVGGLIYNSMTYSNSFSSEDAKKAYDEFFKTSQLKETFTGNFIFLFSHNAVASLFRITTGIIFAIIPAWLVIDGGISNSAAIINGAMQYNLSRSLLSILPHSIFELPAIIISSSLGVMVFLSLFKPKNRGRNVIQAYKDALIVFLFVILPLLLIAGIIESLEIMIFFFW